MRLVAYLGAFTLSLLAQPHPKFDVASIKLDSGVLAMPRYEPTSLSLRHITLLDLVDFAYGIQMWQMEWRADRPERAWYDVDAKWDDPALKDKWPEMLQDLLVKRFSLVLHLESRPTQMYALSADPKHPDKLAKCRAAPEDAKKPRRERGDGYVTYNSVPMDVIWQSSSMNGMNGRIIRDTGIEGSYNITTENPQVATPEEQIQAARQSFARCGLVINAVEKPLPYLIVTSAGKLIPN